MRRNTHGAFPGLGLRPCFQIYSLVWSGNRTRNTRFIGPMLYPIELSIGGRTGFEPVANGLRRCSASELPSARGTPSPDPRHTPRQRRAHRAGMRARAAVDRSSDVPHWPLVEEANPCAMHPARRPCRSIKARRIHAPARLFPASGQQCPDASGARCNRVDRVRESFANAENETPPGAGTRGRSRCLGRSGRPISAMREDQSMVVVR